MAAKASGPAPPPFEITLFGTFAARVQGSPLPPLRSRADQWLLALLALRHPQPTERAWLAETLWPDSDLERARFYLRRSLTQLRQALGPEAHRLVSPTPQTLTLDLSGAVCDLLAFDAALTKSDPASLQQAVELYRGELLEGCAEEWALPEREAREQAYLKVLETLADQAEERQDYSEAIGLRRRILVTDPYRESTLCRLMEMLAAQGDFAALTQVYRDFRLTLHKELNTVPSAETAACYDRLHARAPDRLAASSPASASLHLPTPQTSLLGREKEIKSVAKLLRSARLVTLTGVGGIGKTRLALAAAQAMSGFSGGVWFVSLAEITEPSRILDRIRAALGLRRTPDTTPLQQLRAQLGDHPTLLLLDNCEQLLPEAARIVEELLEHLPRLTLLTTSRQRLRVSAERDFPVPSLPVPPPEKPAPSPEACLAFPGVALFVERAQQRKSDFRLTPENVRPVASVCAALEGIPLAVELTAAWAHLLTPEQMQTRLMRRFDLLKSLQQDIPTRHRSLWATLEVSYRLLPPEMQRFFARQSVFRGGWTLEAAEAVCEEPRALEFLAHLHDASLLEEEEREGIMRYRYLETVREFAAEQWMPEEQAGTLRRYRDYFLSFAEQTDQKLHGPEQTLWYARLEAERENFRAVLADRLQPVSSPCPARNAAEPDATEASLRLAAALKNFWKERRYWQEARQWYTALLALPDAANALQARADALNGAAYIAAHQVDCDAARAYAQESLTLCRQIGHMRGLAFALVQLGLVPEKTDYDWMREQIEQGLALWRELGDTPGIAEALFYRGYVALNVNDFTVAQRCWEEAWTLYRALDSPNDMTDIRLYLILLAIQMGDLAQAQMLCEEELPGCRERGDLFRTASVLKRLAEVAQNRGDFTGARALMEESLPLCRQEGNPLLLGEALRVTGRLALIQGDYATGRALWEEELQIVARMGVRRQGWEHLFLSRSALFFDDPVTARHYAQEALTLARAEEQYIPMAQAFLLLRDLAARAGTTGETLYSQQLQELAATGHRMDIGWAYLVISDEAVSLGRDSIAISYLEEAQRYLAESEPVSHLAPLYLLQGGIAIRQGDYRKGRSCLTEYLRCCHETLESPYYRYCCSLAISAVAILHVSGDNRRVGVVSLGSEGVY